MFFVASMGQFSLCQNILRLVIAIGFVNWFQRPCRYAYQCDRTSHNCEQWEPCKGPNGQRTKKAVGAYEQADRRDKRPGPPIDFTISTDGPITHLAWTAPTTGGPPVKYVLEAQQDGKWREVLDFDADNTRAAVPASEVQGAETWRLRASNDHGMGKPSDEVEVLEVDSGSDPEEGTTAEEPESDDDGTT